MECTTNRYKHAYAHTDKEMHYFHIRLYAWVAFNGHLTKMEESNTHAFLCSAFFFMGGCRWIYRFVLCACVFFWAKPKQILRLNRTNNEWMTCLSRATATQTPTAYEHIAQWPNAVHHPWQKSDTELMIGIWLLLFACQTTRHDSLPIN